MGWARLLAELVGWVVIGVAWVTTCGVAYAYLRTRAQERKDVRYGESMTRWSDDWPDD